MAQPQVAGALVLERLREHILSGIFLGRWSAGDRLPSVRDVARREGVDRKTVAAAYRLLETDGLVQVRPRSGIYLRKPRASATAGALERLHRKWLEHTYHGAHALGFGTERMLELIRAVAEAEREPVPVVECNAAQAEALAAELRDRAWVNAIPHLLADLSAGTASLDGAELVVTTPHHTAEVVRIARHASVQEVAVAPDVLQKIRNALEKGPVVIATGSNNLADKLTRAFEHGHTAGSRLRVLAADDRAAFSEAALRARTVIVWPGSPAWVAQARPVRGVDRVQLKHIISEASLAHVRNFMLERAMRRVKRRPAVKRPSGGV